MKTNELKDLALDYAVILALFPKAFEGKPSIRDVVQNYPYSTDWAQGGPIIERERIRLDCPWDNLWDAAHVDCKYYAKEDGYTGWVSGPTPLVAAMRCFVVVKLGDEITIPEELK